MTWIRVEADTTENDKVRAFADDLGISAETATGFLVRFWGNVAKHRPGGDVGPLSDGTLEDWALWRGRAGRFAKSFRKRFVIAGEISGWADRQGKLIERAEKERLRKRRGKSAEISVLRNGTEP